MRLGRIFEQICHIFWGDELPPDSAASILAGESGLISLYHRGIQAEGNYWFMEEDVTIELATGGADYILPFDLKKITNISVLTDGAFSRPLFQIGDTYAKMAFGAGQTGEPLYFQSMNNQIILYPTPNADMDASSLNVRCFRFLTAPTDTTFDQFEDDLTTYGANLLIAMVAAELAATLNKPELLQVYSQKVTVEQEKLNRMDFEHRKTRSI